MNIKQVYVLLSVGCLIGAMVDMSWRRYLWALFAFAFLFGADAIKDVEKVKRKERDLTEIRMKQQHLDEGTAAMDSHYDFMKKQLTETTETLLKQLATYVRTGVPDSTGETIRTHEHHETKENE